MLNNLYSLLINKKYIYIYNVLDYKKKKKNLTFVNNNLKEYLVFIFNINWKKTLHAR